MDVSDLPEVLTVEEAARFLRIGRNLAFQEAARFRSTDGAEGIPNYRIGRALRVPKAELLRRFGLAEARGDRPAPAPHVATEAERWRGRGLGA